MAVFSCSKVFIIDNSGARIGRCIQIYKVSKKRGAGVGCIILLTVKLALPDKKIKQGDLSRAVVVCSQDWITRFANYRVKAYSTFVILLFNLSLLPRGKRARGLMLEEVSHSFQQSQKTLALASAIVQNLVLVNFNEI